MARSVAPRKAVSFALQGPVSGLDAGQCLPRLLQPRRSGIDEPGRLPLCQQWQVVQAVAQGRGCAEGVDPGQDLVATVTVKTWHQAAEAIVHPRPQNAMGQTAGQLLMQLTPHQGARAGGEHPAALPFGQQQGARLTKQPSLVRQ